MNKKTQANRTLEAVSTFGTVNINSRTEDTLCRCLLLSSWSWTRNFPWWNSYTRVHHEAKWHVQYWSTPVLPLQINSQPLHQLAKLWQLFLTVEESRRWNICQKVQRLQPSWKKYIENSNNARCHTCDACYGCELLPHLHYMYSSDPALSDFYLLLLLKEHLCARRYARDNDVIEYAEDFQEAHYKFFYQNTQVAKTME